MHKLLLLTMKNEFEKYHDLLTDANLQNLCIVQTADPDVEMVLGEPNLIREVLAELPALKWVQSTWAGVELLLDPSLRHDYFLTNARGVFGGLMSEFVFGYLLLHERKILQRLEAQKLSKWEPIQTGTLKGKTIGLLGVGSIGSVIADTARHFGMYVQGYTRRSETSPNVDKYYHADQLLAFAAKLDVLVSVLPNTPATEKIIGKDLLAALPDHAIFINVGRGNAVDEQALLEALDNGRISLAVLDVFEQEPLPPEHPFWRVKNLIITSHTSAPSLPDDLASIFIENYLNFITHKPLNYLVNFDLGY